MRKRTIALSAACAGVAWLLSTAAVAEVGDNSSYYEDDAWYDVTEWFDGNDYNPTDEAIGRWDNESFEFSDAATSSDRDSDRNYGDYGYASATADDNRWFYDYYDDGYGAWYGDGNAFDSYNWYYDRDDDGLYDAYSSYYDSDGDGAFDRYVYHSFDDGKGTGKSAKNSARSKDQSGDAQTAGSTSGQGAAGNQKGAGQAGGQESGQQQAADRMKNASAKQDRISGTIQKTKVVQVHGTKHVVAQVQTKDGQTVAVDLGTRSNQPKKDAQLQASGPRLNVGDKSVIIARQAQVDGNEVQIRRDGREYQGQVESTREVTVHGHKHLLAKVKTDGNKSMLVDLGPADKLAKTPQKGNQVTVEGVPVKVHDRVMLMAQSLTSGGNTVSIDRKADQQRQGAEKARQES